MTLHHYTYDQPNYYIKEVGRCRPNLKNKKKSQILNFDLISIHKNCKINNLTAIRNRWFLLFGEPPPFKIGANLKDVHIIYHIEE